MEEKDRESVALFRYGLIAPLINGQEKNQKEYLAKIAGEVYQVPYYGRKEYTPKAIERWLRCYRRNGFDGLKPSPRSDRGMSRVVPEMQEELILEYRKDKPDMPISIFYDRLLKEGIVVSSQISRSTVYRLLKKHGMTGREIKKEPERKRFSYDRVNILWQGDTAVGPYLTVDKKKVKTYLFAFIDDCSRIIPYAKFLYLDNTDSLKVVFKEALIRRGIPRIVYVDNAKIFRSDIFHIACASLGINLAHSKAYDASSRGKIERFFRTVRQRFLSGLENMNSLDELNSKFWAWLEEDYHRRVHSSLEMTPLDVYLSQVSNVRTVEDPEALDLLFLKREFRKVKHDGTISINRKLFEVDSEFIGEKIEVRFENDLSRVLIFKDGMVKAEAKPINLNVNAIAKRTISFQDMKGEDGDV